MVAGHWLDYCFDLSVLVPIVRSGRRIRTTASGNPGGAVGHGSPVGVVAPSLHDVGWDPVGSGALLGAAGATDRRRRNRSRHARQRHRTRWKLIGGAVAGSYDGPGTQEYLRGHR